MAFTVVESKIPSRLVAGESVSWKWSDSDFPAPTWELTYTLVKSDTRIQIVASADGADHLVEIAKATTAAYTVGEYDWQAHVGNGTERYKVGAGIIEIVTDFAEEATGYDARSHAKIVLDALEASIEGRASKTQLEQAVAGVQVKHMTLMEQVKLRDNYAARYRRELVADGKLKSRRQIKARFTTP
jgi:hypothetical protein